MVRDCVPLLPSCNHSFLGIFITPVTLAWFPVAHNAYLHIKSKRIKAFLTAIWLKENFQCYYEEMQ